MICRALKVLVEKQCEALCKNMCDKRKMKRIFVGLEEGIRIIYIFHFLRYCDDLQIFAIVVLKVYTFTILDVVRKSVNQSDFHTWLLLFKRLAIIVYNFSNEKIFTLFLSNSYYKNLCIYFHFTINLLQVLVQEVTLIDSTNNLLSSSCLSLHFYIQSLTMPSTPIILCTIVFTGEISKSVICIAIAVLLYDIVL